MTKEELAKILDGREYGDEISNEETQKAKNDNLLIAFGASDDLLEFRGVIDDEVGAYEGVEVIITHDGTLIDGDDLGDCEQKDDCRYFREWLKLQKIFTVKAEWCPDGFDGSFRITASVPRAAFNIYEDDELYCMGIVIDLNELGGE